MTQAANEITLVKEGYKSFAEIVKGESHGGKVLLYTEEGRRGDDCLVALSLAGMQIVRRDVSSEVLSDYALLLDRTPPENVMAIAAAGGAAQMEAGKAARIGREVPRLLFPLDLSALNATDERAFFGTKSELLTLSSDAHRIIFSSDILVKSDHIREGLGFIVASLAEEIDGAYEALLEKGVSPAPVLRSIKEKGEALRSLREEDLASGIVDYVFAGNTASPRSSSAHALACLAARAHGGNYTEYLFPAAYALIRLYASYLGDLPLEHCPPPDRARNIELLSERCALSSSALIAKSRGYLEGYGDRMRLTAEYRADLSEALGEDSLPLSLLSRFYRRAPAGKSDHTLSAEELLRLLSLTGEAVSGYPLVKHIKMTGLIEPLLLSS